MQVDQLLAKLWIDGMTFSYHFTFKMEIGATPFSKLKYHAASQALALLFFHQTKQLFPFVLANPLCLSFGYTVGGKTSLSDYNFHLRKSFCHFFNLIYYYSEHLQNMSKQVAANLLKLYKDRVSQFTHLNIKHHQSHPLLLQDAAMRLLSKTTDRFHITPALIRLRWLSVRHELDCNFFSTYKAWYAAHAVPHIMDVCVLSSLRSSEQILLMIEL